jgi:hypothetical protein
MKKINNLLNNKIIFIVSIFLLLQPILDLITGIQTHYYDMFLSVGVIFRFLFMLFMIYYVIFVADSKYKKYSIFYFILLFLYILFFLISTIYFKDMSLISEEIKWLIKNLYFPILLVGFINVFNNHKERIENITFIKIIAIYVFIIIICKLIGIETNAYTQGKTGYIGLFYSANEISGIISLLLPFLIFYRADKNRLLLKAIIVLGVLYCTLIIGSKTAFLSLLIIIGVYIVNYFIKMIKARKYRNVKIILLSLILSIVLISIVLPYTAFYKNIKTHVSFLDINNITEIFEGDNFNRLIFSDRLTFLQNTKEEYDKASIIQKIVGIGYASATEEKTIEMDYFDIYYRYGILGFITYFLPLVIALITILRKVRKAIFDDKIIYVLSLSLALILALFTGHIFTAPSVSIYVSLMIGYLVNAKSKETSNVIL